MPDARRLGVFSLLGALACTGAPETGPAGPGTIRIDRFPSPALGVSKRYAIYLPAGYAENPGRRYPVVYLLHGLRGNEGEWVARAGLDVVADSLAAAGLPAMILVMPDGDGSFYVNWAESPGFGGCAADSTLPETADAFCVHESRYGDYVARDLVTHVDSVYRTMASRRRRAVAGLSMGGTGALTLALNYPDVFAAAAALGAVAMPMYLGPHPYRPPHHEALSFDTLEAVLGRPLPGWRMRWGTDTSGWWRTDPARAARRLRAAGGAAPALRLDVGGDDPYLDENRALAAELAALDLPPDLVERPGGHTWAYWRAHIADNLVWLARHLARD
jgi:putative tributyrin esterase